LIDERKKANQLNETHGDQPHRHQSHVSATVDNVTLDTVLNQKGHEPEQCSEPN
jgi:hypothetical protein